MAEQSVSVASDCLDLWQRMSRWRDAGKELAIIGGRKINLSFGLFENSASSIDDDVIFLLQPLSLEITPLSSDVSEAIFDDELGRTVPRTKFLIRALIYLITACVIFVDCCIQNSFIRHLLIIHTLTL